jgi:hypothetical protein
MGFINNQPINQKYMYKDESHFIAGVMKMQSNLKADAPEQMNPVVLPALLDYIKVVCRSCWTLKCYSQ